MSSDGVPFAQCQRRGQIRTGKVKQERKTHKVTGTESALAYEELYDDSQSGGSLDTEGRTRTKKLPYRLLWGAGLCSGPSRFSPVQPCVLLMFDANLPKVPDFGSRAALASPLA